MATRPTRAAGIQGRRRNRTPQHPFSLVTAPFVIQPFLIAPVLPGETMRNLLMQARVVTDPVGHPLIGWWNEHYLFYVKHRDLNIRDELTAMMLDPAATAGNVAAAKGEHYHAAGMIDWTAHCLERVTEEYFRNEGEAWNEFMINGLPVASVNNENWMNSLIPDSDYIQPGEIDADTDGDGTITAREIEGALQMWQFQRDNQLTDMDYEDFLATYGIRTPAVELHRPELLRYVRNWQYPTNTIDPTDGSPSSALSWVVQERADKDRLFREPGFVFGVQVTRPKIYLAGQKGSAVDMMQNALSWLPAIMMHDPRTSLALIDQGTGVLPDLTDAGGYWYDIRDLFMYGDQFISFMDTEPNGRYLFDLPAADAKRRYPSATDLGLLGSGGASIPKVRTDGIVTLTVASFVDDTSPGTPVAP